MTWGDIASGKGLREAVRFVLADRVVSYPLNELRRWEHLAGNPEHLLISVGEEMVRVEGRQLIEVRLALDESRLLELRVSQSRPLVRGGTVISRITIEPA
ncbi:MAG: hypothetical protein R3F03_14210 [Opitutaceae bacterium]